MASFIDSLLNAIQGPAMDQARQSLAPQQNPDGDTISVTGQRPATAPQQEQPNWQFQKRHGLMGAVNGILETLGDVALTQSGLKPYFGPNHMENLQRQAWAAAKGDPTQFAANVGQFDPASGFSMENINTDNQRAQDTLDLNRKLRTDALDERQQYHNDILDQRKTYQDAETTSRNDNRRLTKIKLAGNMLADGKASPEDRDALKSWIKNDDANIDDLPDNLLSKIGLTAYQSQFSGPAAAKNAAAHMINATRPRNAPAIKDSDRYIDIQNRLSNGEDVSTGESMWAQNYAKGRGKTVTVAPNAGPSTPSPANGAKYVIRNGVPTLVQ